MKNTFKTLVSCLAAFLFLSPIYVFAATGKQAMVATADPRATRAALDVLNAGGSAADAAIAAQWVLNVVEPQSSGLGGGGFFIYYEAKTGRIYALDGREKAPASAKPDMFLDEKGKPLPFFPDRMTGGLAVGVPGTLKLLKEVHESFGSGELTFANLFLPAIPYAEQGIEVNERLAGMIASQADRLGRFEASRKIFFDEQNQPLAAGSVLVQKDLAETFRQIGNYGIGLFYEGDIARDIVETVRNASFHPGGMTEKDLFFYNVIRREAIQGRYRGYDIFSMAPPSSGGSTLIEMLNILERFDMKHLKPGDGAFVLSEVQRLAFRDRNRLIGDPEFSQIDLTEVLSPGYAEKQAEIILQSWRKGRGEPEDNRKAEGAHTSHISIADKDGNLACFTTTIEHTFGSAMVVPGRGFILNNELTDFDAEPYTSEGKLHPNAPGPGKRPRSSMTPTLVFKEGKPLLVLGSPGGSTIIGTVFNLIVNIIDHGMTPAQALKAPKLINRDGPVEVELLLFQDESLRSALGRRGLLVENKAPFGNAQVIFMDPDSGLLQGESDPRGEGSAEGY